MCKVEQITSSLCGSSYSSAAAAADGNDEDDDDDNCKSVVQGGRDFPC